MSGQHSIIPPSAAGIWGKPDGCPGWVTMACMFPETDEHKQAAAEGEASHEIAELLMKKATRAGCGDTLDVGSIASNGTIVTAEMVDGAKLYADDFIREYQNRVCKGGISYGIESKVSAPNIHAESYGTVDAWLYDPKTAELLIWDYKFGFLVVEVFENWQGINYAGGLVPMLGIDGVKDQYTQIRFRIAQPRAHHSDGPIREWAVTASDLRAHFNILSANAYKALSAEAVCNTGSHCRYCQARHGCAPALKAGLGLYEMASAPVPVELSVEALGYQLSIITRAAEQLKALKSGYEAQVESLVRKGTDVPGWSLIPATKREVWTRPNNEVINIGDMMGLDLRKDVILTPNQARQMGLESSILEAFSERPSGGLKLVIDNGNQAKQAFS